MTDDPTTFAGEVFVEGDRFRMSEEFDRARLAEFEPTDNPRVFRVPPQGPTEPPSLWRIHARPRWYMDLVERMLYEAMQPPPDPEPWPEEWLSFNAVCWGRK